MGRPIGGFFELDLPKGRELYHSDAIALTTGRSCIGHVLDMETPKRVIVPDYSCYAVYEPMIERGIDLLYYEIDEQLNPVNLPDPKESDLLLFVNFFGLKNVQAASLAKRLKNRVLIDDTHRYFHKGYAGSYSFTSARKYFGVPDGAFLYTPERSTVNKYERSTNIRLDHSALRLCEAQERAFNLFQLHESSLDCQVLRISKVGEQLLRNIDNEEVMKRRVSNFKFLDSKLRDKNLLVFEPDSLDSPFCYPLLPQKYVDKSRLFRQNIFIPTYWPDVITRKNSGISAINLTNRLLSLPIDHRYSENDMERLATAIMNLI